MPTEGLAVEGLTPLLRDFNKISKGAAKVVRDTLREAAAPVAIDARFRAGRFGRRTVLGIKVIVRQRGVSVEQTARKSPIPGRRRSNIGGLEQTTVMDLALADNIGSIERRFDERIDALLDGRTL